MGSEGYCSWVGVSVCLSELTSGVSVRSKNAVTYSIGQKICRVFCEIAVLHITMLCAVSRIYAHVIYASRVQHFSAFILFLKL